MWKRFFFIICLLACTFQCAAEDAKINKETFVSSGKARTYYLFAPASLGAKTPAPLLLTLHGSGRNGKSLVEQWKNLASAEGLIVAGLDATNEQAWAIPADGPALLYDLVEHLKTKYSINDRKIYLFGHSAGGNFALLMAMLESEYFAAVAIHAGAIHKDSQSYIDYAKRKIPIAIFVGDQDQFFPLQMIKETKEALEKRGIKPEVTILKNHDHNYYNLAPKLNKFVWDFLKPQLLLDAPLYKLYDIQ